MRSPDFTNLLRVLECRKPTRPTLFEFFMNGPLYQYLAGVTQIPGDALGHAKVEIQAFYRAGYDYATSNGLRRGTMHIPRGTRKQLSSISLNKGSLISDRESFENFKWVEMAECDYSQYEEIGPLLPEGMKIVAHGPGGVLENAVALVGYESLCIMSFEDPGLLQDIFDGIGARLLAHYEQCLQFDTVGGIIGNDDWGFNTQTMLSPADMEKYVFPWHRKIVAAAHKANKPAVLHSCGNLADVMDVIIDDIGYDGKHSFEDKIQPVEDAYGEYGGRIAIMGGIDMDFVCRKSPEQIRRRCENMLRRAAEKGGYALGTGNSVPEYVPEENYFAMIETAVPRGNRNPRPCAAESLPAR